MVVGQNKIGVKFVVLLGLYLALYTVACDAVNPCCSFPCQNGAVCVDDGDEYTCDCTRTGHFGVNCEKPNWSTWFYSLIAPSEESKHFILTHFNWFWWIVNNVPFIRNTVMKAAYFSRTDFIPVPHVYTSYHEYPTMEAHYNRSYFARTLPPVPKNCPTPFGVAGTVTTIYRMINDEEWPPYLKDVSNFTMQYPPDTPEDQKFALGHPFYSMLPGLFMYATIWIREHNRVCTILMKEHPYWEDERLYQTGKLIITGELIKIVIEDYVNHLANYNLKLKYNPELLFDKGYDYDNRIHLEFNHMYHWHPFSPDEFIIDGSTYTIDEFMYHPEIVIKHGMKSFVDSMSRGLCGKLIMRQFFINIQLKAKLPFLKREHKSVDQMSHHNHGKYTLEVGVEVIKHQRRLRMQSFNQYRQHFALEPYKSFEEMTGDPEMAAELQETYGDVNAVDLYVGFFLEKSLATSPFGITMINYDRFWSSVLTARITLQSCV